MLNQKSNAVDLYLFELDEERRLIAEVLRQLLLESRPGVEEKLRYKVPFYDYRGMMCYLSPLKTGGIQLGFCNGHLMKDPERLLEGTTLKVVRHLNIRNSQALELLPLQQYIEEAIRVKEEKKTVRRK